MVNEAFHRVDLGTGAFRSRVRELQRTVGGRGGGTPPTVRVTMVTTASLARGSSVFLSTDLSSSGYLVSR
jgi:hypothetical protein